MMKILLSILFLLGLSQAHSQFGNQHIITLDATYPVGLAAGDINGNGKLDVVIAARSYTTLYNVSWVQNVDGLGNFGPLQLIGTMEEAKSVHLADLDGDGDMDVLAVSSYFNRVVLYENLDGQGSFRPKLLDTNADGAFSVIAADLDGDGDLDVISASGNSGLAWYENLDGQGYFGAKRIIEDQIQGSRSVVAVDLDGDGDLDILGNAAGSNKIFWKENLDGLGNFGPLKIIDSTGLYANVVFAADIDGDGDMDVVFVSPVGNELGWYENLDGLGNFGIQRTISNTLQNAWTVYAADLDNDGDMDLIATRGETFGGEVVWFENLDGLGNFSGKNVVTTDVQFPRSVIVGDIDNDGALDIISASQNDNKVAWYRNLVLGVEEYHSSSISLYPNPARDRINIDASGLDAFHYSLYDVFGHKVLQTEENPTYIDVSHLQNGIYFLKIFTDSGEFSVKKIIKR